MKRTRKSRDDPIIPQRKRTQTNLETVGRHGARLVQGTPAGPVGKAAVL
jgi:hypothetical protein